MGRLQVQAQPPPTVLYLQKAFEQDTVAHYLLVISVAKQHLDSGLHKVDAEEKNCCYFWLIETNIAGNISLQTGRWKFKLSGSQLTTVFAAIIMVGRDNELTQRLALS